MVVSSSQRHLLFWILEITVFCACIFIIRCRYQTDRFLLPISRITCKEKPAKTVGIYRRNVSDSAIQHGFSRCFEENRFANEMIYRCLRTCIITIGLLRCGRSKIRALHTATVSCPEGLNIYFNDN